MKHKNFGVLYVASLVLLSLFAFQGCVLHKHDRQGAEGPKVQYEGNALSPRDVVQQPLHFDLKKPGEWKLDNGLRVMFERDSIVPMVHGTLYLPGGSIFEPAEQAGLASATGQLLREGGIEWLSPDVLDSRLDGLGASVESSYAEQYGAVSFSCLTENLPEILQIFSGVVRRPRFDAARLDLWKRMALEGIARRRDDPDTMAAMIFAMAIYGDNTPYNRVETPETIQRISVEAMRNFYRKFSRPNGAILVISGDVAPELLKELVDMHFGSWASNAEILPSFPDQSEEFRPGLYVLKRQFDQSAVLLGHIGPPRIFPEMYSIGVFNRLFGMGGLESRLFSEIRTKEGLAYSVYGGLFPGLKRGNFQISIGTRNQETARAIKRAIELTEDATRVPPSADDVKFAQEGVNRSFVFKFATPALVAQRAAVIDLLGYPKDYDATYLDRIRQVDPNSILAGASKWVHPDKLTIVVVGNVDAKQLSQDLGRQISVREVEFDVKPKLISGAIDVSPKGEILK